MVIATLTQLEAFLPALSARMWYFWSEGMTAAACLAVLTIVFPGCYLASGALQRLHSFVKVLERVRHFLPRESARGDVEWIASMYDRARMSQTVNGMEANVDGNQLQTLGWRLGHIIRNEGKTTSNPPLQTALDPELQFDWLQLAVEDGQDWYQQPDFLDHQDWLDKVLGS